MLPVDNDLQILDQVSFKRQGPLRAPQSSEAMPTVDEGTPRVCPPRFSQFEDSVNSVHFMRDSSIYTHNFRITVQSERQQAKSSSADLPQPYEVHPRLTPRDYHEKVIEYKIPPKTLCITISEPAATANQLTQSRKRDVTFDSYLSKENP